ncbi:MAG TPA: PQQ-dependent sugar dehydrogenase [Gemmatimonadaceae bacterium]
MKLATLALLASLTPAAALAQQHCAPNNAGLELPKGFCATLFADSISGARHIAVAPNGDVFVAGRGGRGSATGVTALRDTNHDGVADVRAHFGNFSSSEVRLFDGYLYVENGSGVLRYRMPTGQIEPSGPPDTIVKDMPTGGNHPLKTFVIDKNGVMYMNVGTATNVCQSSDRQRGVPGIDPCVERETRGGIWKFDARKLDQTQPMGEHYGIGIRNSVGMDVNPADNSLWVMQHGRDQLNLWPEYTDLASAESPAEELIHVQEGGDYGWPYCYFDVPKHELLLAPEYGGHDDQQGRCANMKGPVATFPAHWAPNGLLFYRGGNFPARYRSGVFIAFHGSWNRAPEPQAGYRVVFQPLRGNAVGGAYETFASGFFTDGKFTALGGRPTGLAEGPDGALYIADDQHGRVWRVVYVGN